MADWRRAVPVYARCFCRTRSHDGLRRRGCGRSGFPGRSCGRESLRRRTHWLDALRRYGNGRSSLLGRSGRFGGLCGRRCRRGDLRRRGNWLDDWRGDLRGRNCRCDALRGRGRRHRRNNRYWLSAVHAEPCIPRKFRAAFRAIHACRPSLGFHFFSRPYCKPDTTGNRTKQHQARVPTRFFYPLLFPFSGRQPLIILSLSK